ncbi:MAG: hypothetical protein HY897_11530 [Deltaproteobacteria bacterium]|nr:hypothetical protein [Deltaproteobacteria bacterium]
MCKFQGKEDLSGLGEKACLFSGSPSWAQVGFFQGGYYFFLTPANAGTSVSACAKDDVVALARIVAGGL